jgi:hypothetical protein
MRKINFKTRLHLSQFLVADCQYIGQEGWGSYTAFLFFDRMLNPWFRVWAHAGPSYRILLTGIDPEVKPEEIRDYDPEDAANGIKDHLLSHSENFLLSFSGFDLKTLSPFEGTKIECCSRKWPEKILTTRMFQDLQKRNPVLINQLLGGRYEQSESGEKVQAQA